MLCLFYSGWALVHLVRAAHYLGASQPAGGGLAGSASSSDAPRHTLTSFIIMIIIKAG